MFRRLDSTKVSPVHADAGRRNSSAKHCHADWRGQYGARPRLALLLCAIGQFGQGRYFVKRCLQRSTCLNRRFGLLGLAEAKHDERRWGLKRRRGVGWVGKEEANVEQLASQLPSPLQHSFKMRMVSHSISSYRALVPTHSLCAARRAKQQRRRGNVCRSATYQCLFAPQQSLCRR